ncbi:cilia- and flagella-associated protein 53 [Hippocampus zosterae]|uniref:cilia- and flagella-associated protein 53 n=1 Tax=Hippocampus zosterae TaxID=109293 RepID=UPI00223DF25E|nr:cilia- and flagella-associated protein 53 [Hippocampus zosterae]
MLPARRAMLLRQKQDQLRERATEGTRENEACRVNNCWLLSSDARYVGHTVRRDVDDVMMQHRFSVHQRQQRLRELLDEEERQLVLAARLNRVTPLERQTQMRERAKSLIDAREAQRRQVVAQKLDQQFREQCQELREAQTKRRVLQISEERAAQIRSQQECALARQREEDMFHQMWQADAHAKEERERREASDARHCNQMQMDFLCEQMAAAERLRQRERLVRQEEARQEEEEMQALREQVQRERHLKRDSQTARRQLLDESFRLKMERMAKEQEEELQMGLKILHQSQKDETQAQQETADKRASMREEDLRFRQYLAEQMIKRKKDEEQMEQMMAAKMKETWDERDRQNLLQQEARNRLMSEVMESRRLQNVQKQHLDFQRRADLAKERVELDAAFRDMKRADEEVAKRQRQAYTAYQTELRAQMEQRQRERKEKEEEELREQQRLEQMEQEKLEKKDEVMARPNDGVLHPFRKADTVEKQE